MGGYGSGRPRERPAAELSQPWPLALILPAVRALLRAEGGAAPGQYIEVRASVVWRRFGEMVAELPYRVRRSQGWPDLLMVEAPATDGEALQGPVYPLESRPSNLGRGVVWYWRCPACHELARVLYRNRWGRWECRRCTPVIYASSRESDGRVSALLADSDAWSTMLRRRPEAPRAGASAGELARQMRGADTLILAIKAADKLGLGVTRPPRDRTHAGQGRRWSAKRRAAQPKKT
jgi:hypothetical protein